MFYELDCLLKLVTWPSDLPNQISQKHEVNLLHNILSVLIFECFCKSSLDGNMIIRTPILYFNVLWKNLTCAEDEYPGDLVLILGTADLLNSPHTVITMIYSAWRRKALQWWSFCRTKYYCTSKASLYPSNYLTSPYTSIKVSFSTCFPTTCCYQVDVVWETGKVHVTHYVCSYFAYTYAFV